MWYVLGSIALVGLLSMLLLAYSLLKAARREEKYQCSKLGGTAHVDVEYLHVRESRFLLGFDCDRAADCGIKRSIFSNSPNYTVDCPIYDALENNF